MSKLSLVKQGEQPLIVAPPATAITPRQLPLITRKAIIEYPQASGNETADSLGEVEADDHQRYYIKGDAHGRLVRASEWLSTFIAEEVHIGAPAALPIQLSDGSIVFGSRRIACVSDKMITVNFLITPTNAYTDGSNSGLISILSSIYALDLFLNNDDRHFGNYLSIDDGGIRRLYVFDFSRALFWNWPWHGFPAAQKHTKTGQCGVFLRQAHGFDIVAAGNTIDRLEQIDSSMISSWINRMPEDWLPVSTKLSFLDWWASDQKPRRLEALRGGLTDGSLL
ncbi:MAG: HipA family kinase [Acetobacter fabarum]|uniref:HipA family kinase n=1 Tax=Acetobacter fabarum TaxID=483199 RepID=UPI0039E7F32A